MLKVVILPRQARDKHREMLSKEYRFLAGYDHTFDYTDEEVAHHAHGHVDNWPSTDLATPYLDAYYYAITTLTTVGYGDRCVSVR
eukprot:COSAG06_NODE_30094_length_544_cov_29.125843_2_plen_84_part_01